MVNEDGQAKSDAPAGTAGLSQEYGTPEVDWSVLNSRRSHFSPEIPRLVEGALVPKLFYNLTEAGKIANCTGADLLHYAGRNKLRLHTSVPQSITLHAGDSISGYWGQRDTLVELLTLSPQACRRIEVHGGTWEDRFLQGWRIDSSGYAVMRIPEHQDPGAGGMGAVWGCFSLQGVLSPIQIRIETVFVLSFDLDALLKGQPTQTPDPSEAVALSPSGHDYISDELRWMLQGASTHWRNIDPRDTSTFPSNGTVSAWLQEVHGMSLEHAKTAASIMRLPFARRGGRPKSRISDKKT